MKPEVYLGIIVARGGSKGLPGKNLRTLQGKPLIVHTIQAAQDSTLLSDFLVSTDDSTIAEVSRSSGASVPFLRPPHLATDESSPWPAAHHAVEEWERNTKQTVAAVVLLPATSPLRAGVDIDQCILRFQELDTKVCATAFLSHHSPYFDMVELDKDKPPFVKILSTKMSVQGRRQDKPDVYVVNGAVFVLRRSLLPGLENHFSLDQFAITEMPGSRSIEIDSEDDLLLAENILCSSTINSNAHSSQRPPSDD